MEFNITGDNIEITPAIHDLTVSKFEKIKKHFDKITSAHAIFSVKKREHSVEMIIHVPGLQITAKATSDDLYKALDDAMKKLDRQVVDHKRKVTDHHRSDHQHDHHENDKNDEPDDE